MNRGRCRQEPSRHSPRIAALVLAAGRSRRMGSRHKLLIELAGRPIIAHTVDAVVGSHATQVMVVTGYRRSEVQRTVRGKRLRLVHNGNYRHGLSSSLRRGLAALDAKVDAVLICLGDMPLVTSADINRLIGAFRALPRPAICIPTHGETRGHPVLFPRTLLPELATLRDDAGAKQWIARNPLHVHHVAMKTDAVVTDIDSPMALYRLHKRLAFSRP